MIYEIKTTFSFLVTLSKSRLNNVVDLRILMEYCESCTQDTVPLNRMY